MAPRAIWKGQLSIGAVSCGVALYAAATTVDRTHFHVVNATTGNRVRRVFVDEVTGKTVPRDQQEKGYEISKGSYVVLSAEEMAAAVPEADKSLEVKAFLTCAEVETVYFDKPYFMTPAEEADEEAFGVIREGLRKENVAALAQTVLFRRLRTVVIRARGCGLMANTLHFDYEVQPAAEAFKTVSSKRITGEMLTLAKHIIDTRRGSFDPSQFDDRYDAALAELVRIKAEGGTIKAPKRKSPEKIVDLMEALRASAGADKSAKPRSARKPKRSAG